MVELPRSTVQLVSCIHRLVVFVMAARSISVKVKKLFSQKMLCLSEGYAASMGAIRSNLQFSIVSALLLLM